MNVCFKITSSLLATIRVDLERPHPFAHERLGFLSAGLSTSGDQLLVLAQEYRSIANDDYIPDHLIGAMMGPEAIRKALQWARSDRVAIFHIHTHCGRGVPGFSETDLRENAKFVPDFFKVASRRPHGAIVLSDDAASGKIWFDRKDSGRYIDHFMEIGPPIRKWSIQ